MPPRGLRLFVRPLEPADQPAVLEFLSHHSSSTTPFPACGLLGKLLGDLVAVVALDLEDDAVRIADVVVSRELRRKWIGRVMLREVEQLAVRLDRQKLVVEDAGDAAEFFRRVGFQREGERWVRVVSSSLQG
jgi:ribosomal protein S18 acetylase RimI-like enzyme